MKKLIKSIVLILLTSISFQLFAQESEFDKNIFIQGGLVNDIRGYNLTCGVEKPIGNNDNNRLNIAFNYQKVDQSIATTDVILQEYDYFLSVSYKRYFDVTTIPHLLPYGSIGVLGGLSHTSDGINGNYHFKEKTGFLYGGIAGIGLEYNMNKITPYLEGDYYFTGDHYFRVNIGLKYNF